MLLSGCNNDAPGAGSSSGGGRGATVFTEGDTEVTVAKGHTFAVSLPYTAGTGYEWTAESNPKVQQMESKTVTPSRPGASGSQIITFRAQGKGNTALVLNYARRFEQGVPPAKTASFDVTITS